MKTWHWWVLSGVVILFLGAIVQGARSYLEGQEARITQLADELASSERDRAALQKRVDGAAIADRITLDWSKMVGDVLTTAPDVVTVIERVEVHAPLRLDDRIDDAVFMPLCLRVYQTDRACFYHQPGAACTDTGPGFDPVAWCQGETRPTWRGLVQWIAKLIDRVALERGDAYSLRQWDAEVNRGNASGN